MLSFENARFAASAAQPRDFPADSVAEVAFAGRSNSGKSTAINALARRRNMARFGKTPGRTRTINFYALDGSRYLADLPGYGYASVPQADRRAWNKLVSAYIQSRAALKGLLLVMDARHPLAALDLQLLDWVVSLGKPVHMVLTKADKLSRLDQRKASMAAQRDAVQYPNSTVQLFSGRDGYGVRELQIRVAEWLNQA